MKRIIVLLIGVTLTMTNLNGQINLPSINPKTGKLTSPKVTRGIKVDLSKIKSTKDFIKIRIPSVKIDPAKLTAKSRRSWKVGPWKMTDGNFVIERFRGSYHHKKYSFRDEYLGNSRFDYPGSSLYLQLFPLRLNFRVKAGIEYRLKLKHLGSYSPEAKVIVKVNDEVQFVFMNRNKEFNMFLMENTSKKITISFTGLLKENGDSYNREITFSEILIDQIN